MRVMVFKKDGETRRVIVVPGKAARKPPVEVQGRSWATVRAEVLKVVESLSPLPPQQEPGL